MTTFVVLVNLALVVLGLRILAVTNRTGKIMSTNQQRLDAIGTQLGAIASQAHKAHNEIVNRIEALKNQESDLDFGPLEQVVAELGVAADALDSIVPDEIDAEDPGTPDNPETEPVAAESSDAPAKSPSDEEVPSDNPAESVTTSRSTSKRNK